MASYPLIGKKTVYIDDLVISPDYVQDEAGSITLTPGTTEVSSQSGTINVPNGSYEEMSFELNIICPSVRYLGMLFPELYHNASALSPVRCPRQVRCVSAAPNVFPTLRVTSLSITCAMAIHRRRTSVSRRR